MRDLDRNDAMTEAMSARASNCRMASKLRADFEIGLRPAGVLLTPAIPTDAWADGGRAWRWWCWCWGAVPGRSAAAVDVDWMPAPDSASDPRQEAHADAPSRVPRSSSANAARAIVVVAVLRIVFIVDPCGENERWLPVIRGSFIPDIKCFLASCFGSFHLTSVPKGTKRPVVRLIAKKWKDTDDRDPNRQPLRWHSPPQPRRCPPREKPWTSSAVCPTSSTRA